MTEHDDWLAERRTRLGASDLAKAATGRYGGAAAAVAEKLGIVADEIDPGLADRGHRWEQPIADGVLAHYGLYVAEQVMLTAKDNPRHGCTADGLLVPSPEATMADVVAGLEVKTRAPRASAWDYYRAQSQWSMRVSGLGRWLLAVATIDTDYDLRTGQISEQLTSVYYEWVNRDDYEIGRLIDLADWLWDHVERGVLPDPTDAGALPYVKAANMAVDPTATADLDDLADLIERREQLRAAAKTAEAEEKTIEAKIRHRMGEATEAVAAGRWRVRCGNPVRKFTSQSEADFLELYGAEAAELGVTSTVTVLDRDKAKAEMADQYAALRMVTPDRRLTVKDLRPEENE
jgi:plasmid stabilization system protein ParE